jgi:hypothetical protein
LKGWKSPVNDEATGKEKQDNMEPPVLSVTVYIRCIDAWEQDWAGDTLLQVAAQGKYRSISSTILSLIWRLAME